MDRKVSESTKLLTESDDTKRLVNNAQKFCFQIKILFVTLLIVCIICLFYAIYAAHLLEQNITFLHKTYWCCFIFNVVVFAVTNMAYASTLTIENLQTLTGIDRLKFLNFFFRFSVILDVLILFQGFITMKETRGKWKSDFKKFIVIKYLFFYRNNFSLWIV